MAPWNSKYKAIIDGSAQPWEVERTWQNGRISPLPRHALSGVILGILWLLAVGAMVSTIVVGTNEPIGYITLLFVVPGVFILVRSLRRFLNERRYPNVHVKPARIPVSPGDTLEAVLYSGADASRYTVSAVRFQFRITANKWVERSTASDRSGPRKRRYVMWETVQTVAATSGTAESGAVLIGRFAVDLPEDQTETSRLPGAVTYDWRLEVDASDTLPGYRFEFMLPVFDTRSALERADDALGTVTDAESESEASSASALSVPVAKADLTGLRAYQDSVGEVRLASDGRNTVRRLIRGLVPHTHLVRDTNRAVSVIHVKGDRTVRSTRRAFAAVFVLFAFFLPGPPTLVFFVVAVILLVMGRAAKSSAIALHADETGLQIDEVKGRKKRSEHYAWTDIGMITDTKYSVLYQDIMIPRPKTKVPTIGARIPSKREAEGIAAAIASVRDRYRF